MANGRLVICSLNTQYIILSSKPLPPLQSKSLSGSFSTRSLEATNSSSIIVCNLSLFLMKKLCPNFDREDGLDTVLEVPIPEEMFGSNKNKSCQNLKAWMRPYTDRSVSNILGSRNTEIQLLLGLVGAPLIPLPICCDHQFINCNIKDQPIEASMAKYIVQQYIAGVGGEKALNSIDSMYAIGKVKMGASEFCGGEGSLNKKVVRMKNGGGEMGGFVLWQKRPDFWCLELLVSGCKISAGSDGKGAWRQTPWHRSHASRGPPRPLRRLLQGLDPKSTANLFSNSVCVGEKAINDEGCFVLKLEAEPSSLRARSTGNVEIMGHTVWGYFSQRTGLLVQLEDSHLLRVKASGRNETIYWETTMESNIKGYRTIDGINIAHGGRTSVSLVRFGENSESHSRTRMEEVWAIEEVDFNIKGLSMECFLPPRDLKNEGEEGYRVLSCKNEKLPLQIRSVSARISASKVVDIYVDGDSENSTEDDDEDEDDH